MSSTDSKMLKYAKQIASQAIALDRAKNYREATANYIKAAEILVECTKYTKNVNMKQMWSNKATEYLDRAEELKNMGKKKVRLRSSISNKPSEDQKEGDEQENEDREEELTEEELELEKMVMGTVLIEKPDITWDDIAGLPDPKQALREAIVLPLKRPELFTGARTPWSGILLFGPPGCGKTMLAKAAANEINCTFFVADSASIMSKWLGESEKLVRALFDVARRKAPSIVFFDEIDSIAGTRGGPAEGGGERRLKTQLLQEIQGIKGGGSESKKLLTVMAATNRPWDLDTAFLRRFERKIYSPLPDIESREAIFSYHTRGIEKEKSVIFRELAELTEGYSGSDIAIVCREVIMRPIRELDKLGSLEGNSEVQVRPINRDDFDQALRKIRPTVSDEEIQHFEDWREEFGG